MQCRMGSLNTKCSGLDEEQRPPTTACDFPTRRYIQPDPGCNSIAPSTIIHNSMVSLHRYIRNIRRIGVKEWWRQMQYIGDAKAGRLVGTD